MRIFLILVIALFTLSPAYAQSTATMEQFCKILPNYKPSGDVNYKPGIDAKGRAVMPADINTPVVSKATHAIHVPVFIDLAQRTNLGLPAGTEMDAQVAVLDVYEDGRIDYDGQDITGNATALCGSIKK